MLERVKKNYKGSKNDEENQSIINISKQTQSLDKRDAQKEILKGRFTLKISSQMPFELQIQKFAGENVAFYLHKKRDFLIRLMNHAKGMVKNSSEKFNFQELLLQLEAE
jgi:hypothetical protein